MVKWTGDRLKQLRLAYDQTQAEFGAMIGRTRQTIIYWEKTGDIPRLVRNLLDRLEKEVPKRELQPA